MASRKFEKGSEEWQFFCDYYKFRQEFYDADNEDEWIQELMKSGEMLIEKYSQTNISKYVQSLVFSHFEDVERRWKNK